MKILTTIQLFLIGISLTFLTSCNSEVKNNESTKVSNLEQNQQDTSLTQAHLFKKDTALLGEGAFWNPKSRAFWWVDIEGKSLKVLDIESKTQSTYAMPERIGTVVPDSNYENAVVALQNGIFFFDMQSQEFSFITNPEDSIENIRFNDGKCDPSGRLWVGSMGIDQKPNRASLYKIEQDGTAERMLDSVTISNGICWSSDKKTMYYIDTPRGNVRSFEYDLETGTLGEEKVVFTIPESMGYPDGMTIDEKGNLWVALWNGNAVIQIDPKSGKKIGEIKVPAHNVTSCAFVGQSLDTLLITSARVDMTEKEIKEFPEAGSVFYAVPGVKGTELTSAAFSGSLQEK